jgi:two-component system, OmpR family, aerobic respiration control sensor histidine kinase ArcB
VKQPKADIPANISRPSAVASSDPVPGGKKDDHLLIAHDLRAALSDVVGGLQLIDLAGLDRKNRLQVSRARAAGEILARLLNNAIDHLGTGYRTRITKVQSINLSRVFQGLQDRWAGRADARGIGFEIIIHQRVPAIVVLDAIALERILSNLLENAVKYTDQGRVVMEVDCTEDRALVFYIRDNGPGFSAEARDRLFSLHGRPSGASKPGTGLGLHIAKQLTDLLSGDILVEDAPDKGAQVTLRFAETAWSPPDAGQVLSVQQPPSDPALLQGLRILLAEDNITNQIVASQMLAALGAQAVVVPDGLEALEVLDAQAFDLALLDIEMPRMSGLELIRAIRSREDKTAQMPLIALTAYVMRDHRQRIMAAGADGIIAKPLMSIEDFGRQILRLCGGDSATDIGAVADRPEPADVFLDRNIYDGLHDTLGPEAFSELLGKLLEDLRSVRRGISVAGPKGDLPLVRARTHVLISVAGAIGATRLRLLAQNLNTRANRDDTRGIAADCSNCLAGLDELTAFIEDEQKQRACDA